MIRPAQLKLLEKARVATHLDPTRFAIMLQAWGGADNLNDLAPAGYERIMDHFTWSGFRDKARPVLSMRTRSLIASLQGHLGISNFVFMTILRSNGSVGDLRELSGRGLLNVLGSLERRGLRVETFIEARREITPAQLRLLQLARKQTRMSDEEYSADLHELGGVNSGSDLDRRGFELMMAGMEVAGFQREAPRKAAPAGFGHRPGFATPEQVELIRTLWREWGGPTAESETAVEAGLNTWLERYHAASSLRFLTSAGAGKVITALKTMKVRKSQREATHA